MAMCGCIVASALCLAYLQMTSEAIPRSVCGQRGDWLCATYSKPEGGSLSVCIAVPDSKGEVTHLALALLLFLAGET